LEVLHAAAAIEAMRLATFGLHALKGDLKGFWAVTVRANWRIIFRFEEGKASDVDLVDYH
jgi:proteic killer suppression protein